MAKEDIAPYQRNLTLKREFELAGLDLAEVMEFSPFDLDLENRRIENLLDFIHRFRRFGSRESMEIIEGRFVFPPIFPGIDPESDWYRFELWLQGQPTRMTLAAQLPGNFVLKKPEELNNEDIGAALEQLENALHEAGYGISLNAGIPDRLVYEYLVENLGEMFELGPGWHIDGCSGYCPGCFQRPWCGTGQSSCWQEDEEAGKMSLIETLKPYVSASPQSLEILQRLQAEEDAQMEQFRAENPDLGPGKAEDDRERMERMN